MHRISLLVYSGAQALDIVGPMEVFAEASLFAGFAGLSSDKHYQIQCVSPASVNPVMSNGLEISATDYSKLEPGFDTLIVPGGDEVAMRALGENQEFMTWLQQSVNQSRRVVTVCTGAFILASMGVFNGRKVCTHWGACERLKAFAPAVEVDEDSLFRRDGRFYTSAGVTSGIDLSLALVEEDLGSSVASSIARNLVLYLRRPGGQSQFKQPLQHQHKSGTKITEAINYITTHLNSVLTVEDMADAVAMSPRSFSRLFSKEVGMPPASFVREQRLALASNLLSEGDNSLKEIAKATGFSTQAVLSNAFKRHFGLSPEEYRARFRSAMTREDQ